jgi:hypothetical protein
MVKLVIEDFRIFGFKDLKILGLGFQLIRYGFENPQILKSSNPQILKS